MIFVKISQISNKDHYFTSFKSSEFYLRNFLKKCIFPKYFIPLLKMYMYKRLHLIQDSYYTVIFLQKIIF